MRVGAPPDFLEYPLHAERPGDFLALLKKLDRGNERRRSRPPLLLGKRNALKVKYGDPAGKRLGHVFHHGELLGSGKPEQSGFSGSVYHDLYIRKQFGNVLYLVDQDGKPESADESGRVPFCGKTRIGFVQGYV